MRIKLVSLSILAAVTALPWGCGSDETDAPPTSVNQGKPCEREKDCADDDPCTYEFCIDGACDISPISNGEQPGAEQIPGDCLSLDCVAGVPTEAPSNDPPEDTTEDCFVPACNEGEVIQVAAEPGEFCQTGNGLGVCDVDGMCSCAPVDDGPQFVDPVNGSDDAMHGGGPGACAYATLTYALQQAPRRIRVTPNEFSAATGETLPFVLTGNQRISCYDDNSGEVASLVGSADYQTFGTTVVVFEGGQNQLEDCVVDGQGSDHGVLIVGAPVNDGHELGWVDVSGTTSGVTVTDAGDSLYLFESNLHDNTTVGLAFAGTDRSAFLENNTFSSNGTDVTCADASPNVSGQNNAVSSCTGCQNCNF